MTILLRSPLGFVARQISTQGRPQTPHTPGKTSRVQANVARVGLPAGHGGAVAEALSTCSWPRGGARADFPQLVSLPAVGLHRAGSTIRDPTQWDLNGLGRAQQLLPVAPEGMRITSFAHKGIRGCQGTPRCRFLVHFAPENPINDRSKIKVFCHYN